MGAIIVTQYIVPPQLKCITTSVIRTALHYGGEVHRSWILGELWNLIGREWHSCPVMVHTTTKSPLMKNFVHGWKMTWLPTWQHFLKESSSKVKFLGQPQSRGQETWPLESSNLNRIFFLRVIYLLSCLILLHTIPCLK